MHGLKTRDTRESRLLPRSVDRLARQRAGQLAVVVEYNLAVDDHVLDAFGILMWLFEGRFVDHAIGIEDGDVGGEAFSNQAAIAEAEGGGGLTGHFSDRVFERDDLSLADIS